MAILSVLMPAYNAERFIHETMESVFRQSFEDFELLVLDDGSAGSTLQAVARFRDPRLKVYSYPHAGYAATLNRGLEPTCGSNILARRLALEEVGRLDASLAHAADWDLALRLALGVLIPRRQG